MTIMALIHWCHAYRDREKLFDCFCSVEVIPTPRNTTGAREHAVSQRIVRADTGGKVAEYSSNLQYLTTTNDKLRFAGLSIRGAYMLFFIIYPRGLRPDVQNGPAHEHIPSQCEAPNIPPRGSKLQRTLNYSEIRRTCSSPRGCGGQPQGLPPWCA
jgi:hypothetical protein